MSRTFVLSSSFDLPSSFPPSFLLSFLLLSFFLSFLLAFFCFAFLFVVSYINNNDTKKLRVQNTQSHTFLVTKVKKITLQHDSLDSSTATNLELRLICTCSKVTMTRNPALPYPLSWIENRSMVTLLLHLR